jgi:hypothetical protein
VTRLRLLGQLLLAAGVGLLVGVVFSGFHGRLASLERETARLAVAEAENREAHTQNLVLIEQAVELLRLVVEGVEAVE